MACGSDCFLMRASSGTGSASDVVDLYQAVVPPPPPPPTTTASPTPPPTLPPSTSAAPTHPATTFSPLPPSSPPPTSSTPASCDCGACGCCAGCFFSRANNSCVVCPAGSVSSICRDNFFCEECPTGSYCPYSHMSSPLPCPAGSFADSGAASCTPCTSASGAVAMQCPQQRLSSLDLGIIIAACAVVVLISAIVMFRRVAKDTNSRYKRVLWTILAVTIGPLVWCVWYCRQRGRGQSALSELPMPATAARACMP